MVDYKLIVNDFILGAKQSDIAKKYKVSRQRVGQIIHKHLDYNDIRILTIRSHQLNNKSELSTMKI